MKHLFLSPHYDDAILSCGGLISELIGVGHTVTILSLFTGRPRLPYSSWAQSLHALWGNPQDVVRLRRAEDEAACARLGANLQFAEFQEALYRRDDHGNWPYQDNTTITGVVDSSDSSLSTAIFHKITRYPDIYSHAIYAPLAIGNHIDHQIAFEVGIRLHTQCLKVYFYEDFPYALDSNAYRTKISTLADWSPHIQVLSKQSVFAKIEAFSYYRSQLPMLFGNENKMKISVLTFVRAAAKPDAAYAERLWLPNKS